jgi:two-component system phosphate regulon sensor histidine kinase PhoR
MKKLNSKLLPYLIAVIIAATIGIQVFWNLEQYKTNKQRYINDVQIALDNSIEGYFSEISKTDLITFLDIDKDTMDYLIKMGLIS